MNEVPTNIHYYKELADKGLSYQEENANLRTFVNFDLT